MLFYSALIYISIRTEIFTSASESDLSGTFTLYQIILPFTKKNNVLVKRLAATEYNSSTTEGEEHATLCKNIRISHEELEVELQHHVNTTCSYVLDNADK